MAGMSIWNKRARGGRIPLGGLISDEKRALARVYFFTDVLFGIEHQTELQHESVIAYAKIHGVTEEIMRRMQVLISVSEVREVKRKFTMSNIRVYLSQLSRVG
jgi:hypothetical protein